MSIIKKNIKFNNNDVNLNFSLDSSISFTGYQQEINSLIVNSEQELINPINDVEVRRFTYEPNTSHILWFWFHANNLDLDSFINAGFTANEIASKNIKLLNSFFILDFYDTYDTYTQSKIFTTYLTKILVLDEVNHPIYNINANTVNQFYYLYIPQSYIDIQQNQYITGYGKFSFYNAKNGNIQQFYNNNYEATTTPLKNYFKIILNLNTKTWRFDTLSLPYINAFEAYSSSAYINRVNNTVSNFNSKKQNYPVGNTFNSNGTYTAE